MFSEVRVERSLVFCVVSFRFLLVFFSFCHCVLSGLRFTNSDYPFDIFKLFLLVSDHCNDFIGMYALLVSDHGNEMI